VRTGRAGRVWEFLKDVAIGAFKIAMVVAVLWFLSQSSSGSSDYDDSQYAECSMDYGTGDTNC
jgi:hypothetical protein